MSRYDIDRRYAPAPAPGHDRPRLLNFMLPWAAGIAVMLASQLALAILVWDIITGDDVSTMDSPVRTVLLLHLRPRPASRSASGLRRPCTRGPHGSRGYGTASRRSPRP